MYYVDMQRHVEIQEAVLNLPSLARHALGGTIISVAFSLGLRRPQPGKVNKWGSWGGLGCPFTSKLIFDTFILFPHIDQILNLLAHRFPIQTRLMDARLSEMS